MAQLFSALFFSAAAVAAAGFIMTAMRGEWMRVINVLNGRAMEQAQARANPPVRIRMRTWNRAEARPVQSALRAAA